MDLSVANNIYENILTLSSVDTKCYEDSDGYYLIAESKVAGFTTPEFFDVENKKDFKKYYKIINSLLT